MAKKKNQTKGRGKTRKTRDSFAFLVDGDTEKWYLEKCHKWIREKHSDFRASFNPELPDKKGRRTASSLKEQRKLAQKLAQDNTHVFWIVDLDTIISDSKVKDFIKQRALLRRSKDKDNITVIVNAPCLEFWLLLHFQQTGKYYPCYSGELERELKKHLCGYCKEKTYYTKQQPDIFSRLRERLDVAIERAQILGTFDENDPEKAMCEMDLLFLSDALKKYF